MDSEGGGDVRGGNLCDDSTGCIRRRDEPARGGTGFRIEPGVDRQDVPLFGAPRLCAVALLDRLTHHVHILELNGESYRLKQSKARRRRDPRPADEVAAAADPETGEIIRAS
jgi:hypothetical protein